MLYCRNQKEYFELSSPFHDLGMNVCPELINGPKITEIHFAFQMMPLKEGVIKSVALGV